MRIAYVVHDYHRYGGHSRYVAELASRFKRDHEVHIFANTFEEPEPAGLRFHHVPAWRSNVMASLLSFILPATFMVRGRYDIIHAQGFCGLRQNVVTAHICQGAWSEAMIRRQGQPSWRKRLFQALAYQMERRTYHRGAAKRFIAVSKRTRTDLTEHYQCSDGVRLIYHGVDTDAFHPKNRTTWRDEIRRQLGLPEDAVLALYVGDLQKALTAALRAVARVPRLHLVSLSRSSPAPYRAIVEDLNIADRVHLLPGTPHVQPYYGAADLFVFPTFYDSFGLVATEAMASGLPVVCSSAAGAAELIEDGVTGLVVRDAWDAGQLADALRRLVDDPNLRTRLGRAARLKIEPFTWDAVAQQTMAVYQEIVRYSSAS